VRKPSGEEVADTLTASKNPNRRAAQIEQGASTRQEKGCKKQPRRENGTMITTGNGKYILARP